MKATDKGWHDTRKGGDQVEDPVLVAAESVDDDGASEMPLEKKLKVRRALSNLPSPSLIPDSIPPEACYITFVRFSA